MRPIYTTMSEQIADIIRKDIITGYLKEDEPIRESDLSKKFNVSHGPIRDAFKVLTKEGFLVSKPNVGVRVAMHPTEKTLKIIRNVRYTIESSILENEFDNYNEQDIETLRTIMKSMSSAITVNDHYLVIDLDMSFHKVLMGKHTESHVQEMWQSAVNMMMFPYTKEMDFSATITEHELIVDALEAGDKELCIRYLGENIK